MTISIATKLPNADIQISMSAEDAATLVGEIGSLIKGEITGAEMLSLVKDLIASKLPTL